MFALNVINKWVAKKWPNNWCHILSAKHNTLSESDFNSDLDYNRFKCLAINQRFEAKLKIVLNELKQYRRCHGSDAPPMPSHITVHHMRQLLQCNHMVRRGRMWSDLSAHRRRDLLNLLKKVEDNDGRNQLTAPFVPYEFERLFANRLKTAAMFGQNIVFDISFDSHMSTSECKNLAEQLNRIYQWNRYHVREDTRHMPFNIHLCNVIAGHKTIHFVDFLFPHLTSSESFVNITSKCYTDVFDRRDLIYLSPHATEVMTEYESNAVFIIGGIVDRNKLLDLSYPKARQQNIRSMRLPIDSVVNKSNVQSLDSVFKVLVDFKNAGFVDNFEAKSLATRIRKHFPNHKLKSVQQITDESSTKREMDNILNDLYDSDQQFDDNIANKS